MSRRIAILAYDGCQSLDVLGPMEVFHGANARVQAAGTASFPYSPMIVGWNDEPIRSESGARLLPDARIDDISTEIDTLLIPGGTGVTQVLSTPHLIERLKRIGPRARRVASVCTGAFLLGAAGFLRNRRATTHWAYCDQFSELNPTTRLERDSIFVRDGHVWTSAGIVAGVDLSLALVEEDLSRAIAGEIAQWLVVYLRRSSSQRQLSAQLALQGSERDAIAELAAWITEHPRDILTVTQMARRCAMSVRNFRRVFREELDMSPSEFALRARTDVAIRLLESTDLSVEAISHASGFATPNSFRRALRRLHHVNPSHLRRKSA